jgi:glutamine amidotransferase
MRDLEQAGAALVSTLPLSDENWQPVPFGQLLVFSKGKLIKTGTEHHHEYIHSEEEMKLIYQIFANL